MKIKLFLLAIVAMISMCATAQDKVAVIQQADTGSSKVISDTAKLTVSKIYDDVKEGLKGLGSALKVGSEHVYEVLVRQQIVNSIVWIIISLLIPFIISGAIKISKFLSTVDSIHEYVGHVVGCIILFISSIMLTTLVLCHLNDAITGFVNPEYGALKDIMEFIKPK